jgi:phage-related protein
MGFAINDAQNGDEHPRAKALKGFGGRSVLEVVDDEDGDTTGRLHGPLCRSDLCPSCLPKEVKEGIETPKHETDLIKARLKLAESHYRENQGKGEKK